MKKFKSSEVDIWFTSDLHLNHLSIILYCNRPFSSLEEMNTTLINNWNSVVKPDDIVFCLGDLLFGGSKVWNEIIPKLNGRIYLILGNHDIKNYRKSYSNLFESVSEQLTIKIDKQIFILTHYPLLCYPKNGINLHGHIHLCKGATGEDINKLQYTQPTQYDVGVDLNNFTPIHYNEVLKKIQYQIEHNTNEFCWINENMLSI